MLPLVIDIDGTILNSDKEYCNHCGTVKYTKTHGVIDQILRINTWFAKGRTIILWTGRGWEHYKITIEQLSKEGVKYDQLIMGKPCGIYIDADSLKEVPNDY